MNPINFEGANFTFKKPESMSEEDCGDLPVYKGTDPKGYPMILSAWQPSEKDIEAINAGRPIYLNIVGHGMPPVSVFTTNEAGEANL